ncbi:hypothetical protein SAMN04488056_111131 [Cohaesibacter marisflavi]|uniref:Uncharacterized protein n=1 Tax=Cohaesibacter marisflavi TaxID=655353 RepID=A0A1I5JFG9_9HYPH|nr:hypothetical protein [Cohaesibacter marisflavi]SFO71578.1 hypothetical protein SAMN04488056_111131 [Cohaesibacter marisflavi]
MPTPIDQYTQDQIRAARETGQLTHKNPAVVAAAQKSGIPMELDTSWGKTEEKHEASAFEGASNAIDRAWRKIPLWFYLVPAILLGAFLAIKWPGPNDGTNERLLAAAIGFVGGGLLIPVLRLITNTVIILAIIAAVMFAVYFVYRGSM